MERRCILAQKSRLAVYGPVIGIKERGSRHFAVGSDLEFGVKPPDDPSDDEGGKRGEEETNGPKHCTR